MVKTPGRGSGGERRRDGGRDSTVVATLFPALVVCLVEMLHSVSLLESTKLLAVADSCSVAAPAK